MKRFRRYVLVAMLAISGLISLLSVIGCGVDSPAAAAQPGVSTGSLTTPTVFAVIHVTPVPAELVAQFEGGGSFKAIPPALDTRVVILEPRVEVVQAAWRQYLSDARVTTDDQSFDWVLCADGRGWFTDDERFGDPGRWRVANPPRSLEWHEAVVGGYANNGKTVLVVLSMFEGIPHLSVSQWDEVPSRGGRPSGVKPVPVEITIIDASTGCSVSR